MDEVDAIVAVLRGSQDWRAFSKKLDAWCKSPSRFPTLRRLHGKLVALAGDPTQPSFQSVRDHIEATVALSVGAEHADFAWELLCVRRAAGEKGSHVPAMLAQAHAWPEIRALLAAHRGDPHFVETAAELIVECGLRQHALAGDSVVASVWAELEASRHPLAWLPPEHRPLEGEVQYPRFSVDSQGYGTPHLKPLARAAHGATAKVSFEALAPDTRKAILGAFDGLTTRSNGRVALQAFSAPTELVVTAGLVHALSTNFEPLAGAVDVVLGPIRAESAVAAVLSAPISGGAYGGAVGGCFGRLAGWKALGGIAGAKPLDSFVTVEWRVGESEWLCIEPSTPWFEGIFLDYFLVCLHPGKESGVAIAWTDTD